MAAAAKARGLKYIAITDHSKRVTMAGGLDAERVRGSNGRKSTSSTSGSTGITVLKGIEVDILEQGGLDLPDDVLAEADWVVASIHYGQKQPREQITRRVLGALANPHVSALPIRPAACCSSGKPYEIDMEAVMQAARQHGKMLELNAHPSRLDLDDVACAAAKSLRHSDRHLAPTPIDPEGSTCMRCGVQQARRGGLARPTWPTPAPGRSSRSCWAKNSLRLAAMCHWRELAVQHLPELREVILAARSHVEPLAVVQGTFGGGGDQPIPQGGGRITVQLRVVVRCRFRRPDLSKEVETFFYEDLPVYSDFEEQIPLFITPQQFERLKSVFAYRLTEEEYADFRSRYSAGGTAARRRWPRRRRFPRSARVGCTWPCGRCARPSRS